MLTLRTGSTLQVANLSHDLTMATYSLTLNEVFKLVSQSSGAGVSYQGCHLQVGWEGSCVKVQAIADILHLIIGSYASAYINLYVINPHVFVI